MAFHTTTATVLSMLLVLVTIGCVANIVYRVMDKRDKNPLMAILGAFWAGCTAFVVVHPHDVHHNLVMELGIVAIAVAITCAWLVVFNAFHANHHHRDMVAAATSAVMIPVGLLVAAYYFGWTVLIVLPLVLLLIGVAIGAIIVIHKELTPSAGGHHGH